MPMTKIGPGKLHKIEIFSHDFFDIRPSLKSSQAVATPIGNPLKRLTKKTKDAFGSFVNSRVRGEKIFSNDFKQFNPISNFVATKKGKRQGKTFAQKTFNPSRTQVE